MLLGKEEDKGRQFSSRSRFLLKTIPLWCFSLFRRFYYLVSIVALIALLGFISTSGSPNFPHKRHLRLHRLQSPPPPRLLRTEACSKVSKRCFRVEDCLINKNMTERTLCVDETCELMLSQVFLDAQFDPYTNSSTWRFRPELAWSYAQMFVAAIFFTDAIPFRSPTKENNILSIGLGGSTVNNFLHFRWPQINITVVELDPVMKDLATKWFGFIEDETHRCIIDDGVRFLHQAVEQNKQFDVILLDACHNRFNEIIICPVGAFLTQETISNTRKVLKANGVLIVNVLTLPSHNATNEVINLYSSVFETCFYRPAGGNYILICLPHAKENPDVMQAILDEKFDFVKAELKLDNIEKAIH